MTGRLGLCCMWDNDRTFPLRTMTLASYKKAGSDGAQKLAEVVLHNVSQIRAMINLCDQRGWNYRIPQTVFPLMGMPDFELKPTDLPLWPLIQRVFAGISNERGSVRLSMHPTAFCIPGSDTGSSPASIGCPLQCAPGWFWRMMIRVTGQHMPFFSMVGLVQSHSIITTTFAILDSGPSTRLFHSPWHHGVAIVHSFITQSPTPPILTVVPTARCPLAVPMTTAPCSTLTSRARAKPWKPMRLSSLDGCEKV